MNTAEYEKMYRFESFYWWFAARQRLLNDILKKISTGRGALTMLDVGCGTAINCETMARYGEVYGVDASPEALSFASKRGVAHLRQATAENTGSQSNSFDVVTAMDLLEHTDDDMTCLREMHRVLKPGGTIIITVPAYGFLWSEHDEALQHRRRYTASELRKKLTTAGFRLQRSTYFVSSLFPIILAIRLLQNLTGRDVEAKTSYIVLPRFLNWMLVRLLDVERQCMRFINLPIGVTVLATARKPSSAHGECEG